MKGNLLSSSSHIHANCSTTLRSSALPRLGVSSPLLAPIRCCGAMPRRSRGRHSTDPTRPSQSGAASVSLFGSEGSVTGGGGSAEAALKAEAATMRLVWRRGVVRLVLVSAIAWAMLVLLALAFHLWSCNSSVAFLSGQPKQGPRGFPRFS
jgi:hypothetical protein